MKRKYLPTLLLTVFFAINTLFSFHSYAQTSISGDVVCGRWDATLNGGKGGVVNPCGIDSLKIVSQGIFKLVISIGLPLLVVFIIYRILMAWFALQQGNTSAYKEAGKKITEAIIGFIIIVALFGGLFLAVLKYLGASDFTTSLLRLISSIELIPHAYAQVDQNLPNPLGATSLYDFILSILNTIMKFFLYPAMIAIWVWSGFSYVLAQGAPEKLKKTHNLILWAFISTLVVFMTQAFLVAIRGTVNNILPGSSQSQTTPYQVTTSGHNQPTATGANTPCDLGNGITGITGFDGKCYSSARR